MATQPLPRFLETHETRLRHARQLERVARATGGDLRERRAIHTAADSKTLRGIPAIGRGVAGAVAGTQPEAVVTSPSFGQTPSCRD